MPQRGLIRRGIVMSDTGGSAHQLARGFRGHHPQDSDPSRGAAPEIVGDPDSLSSGVGFVGCRKNVSQVHRVLSFRIARYPLAYEEMVKRARIIPGYWRASSDCAFFQHG